MTGSFLFVAYKEGLGSMIPRPLGYTIGAVITLIVCVIFFLKSKKKETTEA